MTIRVGRKRTIVIPRRMADMLGIGEGSHMLLVVDNGRLKLIPLPDAITLSLWAKGSQR